MNLFISPQHIIILNPRPVGSNVWASRPICKHHKKLGPDPFKSSYGPYIFARLSVSCFYEMAQDPLCFGFGANGHKTEENQVRTGFCGSRALCKHVSHSISIKKKLVWTPPKIGSANRMLENGALRPVLWWANQILGCVNRKQNGPNHFLIGRNQFFL